MVGPPLKNAMETDGISFRVAVVLAFPLCLCDASTRLVAKHPKYYSPQFRGFRGELNSSRLTRLELETTDRTENSVLLNKLRVR